MKKFLVLTLIMIQQAMACEFDTPQNISMFTSLKNETSHAFDENKTLYDIPVIRAFNCRRLALKQQYLMIGLGPELIEYDDKVRSFSFSDEIYPSNCTIKDAPTELIPFEEKIEIFNEKKNYINNCLEIYIEDEGRRPIQITAEQPGCTVEKLTSHKARITGGFCFVKPSVTSTYLIKLKIRKECQTKQGLKDQDLHPGDINAILNFYSSGDESGTSTQLNALHTIGLRTLTNTDSEVIKSSESYGEINPQFPGNYFNPAHLVGNLELINYGPNWRVETPLYVDNRCNDTCKDGLCYSRCRYAQPVAYEISLLDISKKREEYLTGWYDGGVAQPGYQGFIHGNGFEVPKTYIEQGHKYRFEINFNDAKFDFEKLKDRLVRRFGEIQQTLPQFNRNAINDIPDINEINRIANMPEIMEIHRLNFTDGLRDMSDSINLLRSYLGYKLWPPYFYLACDASKQSCVDASRNTLSMKIDFELNEENKIVVNKISTNSPFNGEKKFEKLPEYKCGYDL